MIFGSSTAQEKAREVGYLLTSQRGMLGSLQPKNIAWLQDSLCRYLSIRPSIRSISILLTRLEYTPQVLSTFTVKHENTLQYTLQYALVQAITE